MKNRNIIVVIGLVLIMLIGVSYAFFNYNRIGNNNKLIAGQVYMHYNEGTDAISLTGIFPESDDIARDRDDNYVTFTIDGKNTTTNKDIYYEIILSHGNNIENKTRLFDKHLKFDLIEIIDEEENYVLNGVSYNDLTNQRIWVNIIERNTLEEIEITYVLRMWINENVWISDTDIGADYTMEEYKNSFASIKVNVSGDFEYKDVSTPAACFAYNKLENASYDYSGFILDATESNVNQCMNYLYNMSNGEDSSDSRDEYKSFCEGTGTVEGNTLKYMVDEGIFDNEQINNLGVVKYIETNYLGLNTSEESVAVCMDYMLNVINNGDDLSNEGDNYRSYCNGAGSSTIYDDIMDNFNEEQISYLIDNIVLLPTNEQYYGVEVTNYDEDCGSSMIIPNQIEGYDVISVSSDRDGTPSTQLKNNQTSSNYKMPFNNKTNYDVSIIGRAFGSMEDLNISSIKFPETLRYIGDYAFVNNQLTHVMIPKAVVYIGYDAFYGNYLSDVEIKGTPYLKRGTFNYQLNENFSVFKYNGTCDELNSYNEVACQPVPNIIITKDTNSCIYNSCR